MNYRLLLLFTLILLSHSFLGHSRTTISATTVETIEANSSQIITVFYQQGVLSIKGLTGTGNIKIYSIIGNEIAAYPNVDLFDFQRNISLEAKNMYIIHVESAGEIKLFKLVAR